MKILVTGGAGYIGSVIVNLALKSGFKVKAVDALWYDKNVPIINFNDPNYEFKRLDIRDSVFLNECLEDVDFVVHTAAVVGEPAGKKFSDLTYRVNYEASKRLIDKLEEKQVKGFIFLSTCSNYGISDGLINETALLKPLSLYAETKVNIERYLTNNAKSLDWVICRLSTAYGSSPRMRFDLTVNDFTVNALLNKMLEVYLPKTYRPYIHVYDIARVILRIISDFDRVKNNVFNVGFEGENYQKYQIAEIIEKFVPSTEIKIIKKGIDARNYKVDFSKLKKFLNIEKIHTVKSGVKEIVDLVEKGIITNYKDKKYYNTFLDLKEEIDYNAFLKSEIKAK
ncbi:MAG: SDR family oxidoreductase [Candidatus Omnitrophica bacterium]|nr:SDR family oxidoreductase [Candidatus Omnitrophota bacterium]